MRTRNLTKISLFDSSLFAAAFVAACSFAACEADDTLDIEDWSDSDSEPEEELGDEFRQVVGVDMKLGIQIGDFGTADVGSLRKTGTLEGAATSTWSSWAYDSDHVDPDSARLYLDTWYGDDWKGKDFRACIKAADGGWSYSNQGTKRCTPWASQGGGASGFASDDDLHDPDSYRVALEVRSWPTNVDKVIDARFRIRAWDKPSIFSGFEAGLWSAYTPWASGGGGYSGWALDGDSHDPDGFEIYMGVRDWDAAHFCTVENPCQDGFGDCDNNSECVAGTTCVWNVGLTYGYSNPLIDVCLN